MHVLQGDSSKPNARNFCYRIGKTLEGDGVEPLAWEDTDYKDAQDCKKMVGEKLFRDQAMLFATFLVI